MKIAYYLIGMILLLTSFVIAEDCFGMDASCPDGFYVNCWEDDTSYNWNCKPSGGEIGPEIMPDGSYWCDKGYVIDYNTKKCCPGDYPYNEGNNCAIYFSQNPSAVNYYTERFKCTPNERKCVGYYQYFCLDKTSENQNINYDWWKYNRLRVGVCGYQICFEGDDKCEGTDYYTCENNNWKNNGITKGECDVECVVETDCLDDMKVNTFCENGISKTNFIDYYCSEEYQCEKKANIVSSDREIGICGTECLTDEDCKEPKLISDFCEDGKLMENKEIELCENYECVPDTNIFSSTKIGVCDYCEINSDCGDRKETGKYWKDKRLYYDIIEPICIDNVCSDNITSVDLNAVFETNDFDIDYKPNIFTRLLNWLRGLF